MLSTPPSADSPAVPAPHVEPGDGVPFARSLPWLLLIGGIVGLAAAFVLTVEKFALAADATYIPSCSLNPVLNCGSVMATEQASVFGFPNSLLGIAGFAVVAVTGAGLLAGARFARWYWLGLQAGVTAAAVFVHWLIVQSLYVIGALCPYCMAVWAVTIPIFWYVTLRNLHHGTFTPPVRAAVVSAGGNHLLPVTVWVLGVAALVLHRFFSFWSSLL
ncbi:MULTISPECIES: vitamin K epoxide reductase family protein [unclassified Rhodococcus (in: high G+C Gram-positive bacteria)]|uniref:vitamin K epoxide reductase family protein n=1 Tax=unclassified Rhodococcus (in: high G+C Gram-positive bacteria) TaxID=192944 RepID=UPI00163B22FC|nr:MULTISPECIES: vitamin K epoxide reductase family protein [unclassified Rhodococcus (in: high G+C Gram-positive bacteria)]MBC2644843.1 vitamin K epoxide reductase family protein [Rhodococcus sp. 3A]MBC2890844.1 vitamin K epoxide reductase family protein [Rhodococcus sp. 4CII]